MLRVTIGDFCKRLLSYEIINEDAGRVTFILNCCDIIVGCVRTGALI